MPVFTIDTEGSAQIPRHAERALIHVSVSSSGPNKAAVSDQVITTAQHIENLLKDLSPTDDTSAAKEAAALAHWAKTSMSSTSHRPWDSRINALKAWEYNSRIKFDIRFKKFKELGEFGSRLSALDHAEVTDIDWILTAATEKSHRAQLRKGAAQDALQKAQDYCEVLGCSNLRPVKLQEGVGAHRVSALNQRNMGVSYQQMQMQSMQVAPGHGGANHDGENTLEFRPQEVRMSMSVTVQFHADNGAMSIEPPAKRARSDDSEMSE